MYDLKNRICVECNTEYKPTGTTQKRCVSCKDTPKTNIKKKISRRETLGVSSSHPDYNKLYQREYYKQNPDSYIYWGASGRARKKGIPFNIDLEDIKVPKFCPILGIPLFRNSGGNKPTQNSPSVDKIIPELGYVKGNVQVISQRANVMKNDASTEELLKFADWIYKTYG